jgi:hypothetical protein
LEPRSAAEPPIMDYFNVLTGQGANAPGGPARYIVHGKMICGFDWSRGRHIKAIPE